MTFLYMIIFSSQLLKPFSLFYANYNYNLNLPDPST